MSNVVVRDALKSGYIVLIFDQGNDKLVNGCALI